MTDPHQNPKTGPEAGPASSTSQDEAATSARTSEGSIHPKTAGWADRPALRLVANLAALGLVVVLAFLIWQRITATKAEPAVQQPPSSQAKLATPVEDSTPSVDLQPMATPDTFLDNGIPIKVSLQTILPTRARDTVITYTVKTGDNLFGIAEYFGLKPETLLWGNYDTLKDNPHLLKPDQVLNILPVDGTYYQWHEGDNLDKVAAFFKVDPKVILDYPGNHIDLTQKDDMYGIKPGDWLIVPGGSRPIKDWGPPAISRSNPAVARYYGPGSCGAVYEGAIGTGTFVWPTTEHFISGYHYSSIHPAIDIGGSLGNAVYAADSGVIVYAGWSNFGYGNLIVIDHGNGWQTAYAHLSAIKVGCGQSVFQGSVIGLLGSTGNSTGPHLHFEMGYKGAKLNPLDFLP